MLLYSALLEYGTNILLALSTRDPGILFLHECIPDSLRVYAVNYPQYMKSFFGSSLNPSQYPEWQWNSKTRALEKTPANLLTPARAALSRLAMAKLEAWKTVSASIHRARAEFAMGIVFQETIYLAKKIQAQAFKDSNYDEDRILEYPYVLQYADYVNIPFKQAADDILFKAKLADEGLAKTELLRLTYFNAIKSAPSVEDLQRVLKKFEGPNTGA